MGFLYSDTAEIRRVLEIDPNDHSQDFLLGLFNEWVADIFEQVLDRPMAYATRTVIYPGTGNQKLLLRHRPVYPTVAPAKASNLSFTALAVNIDDSANFSQPSGSFASSNLVLGTDYTIRIDQEDGGSREAILYRINDFWNRPFNREQGNLSPFVGQDLGTIKVTSTAGYTVDTLPATLRAAANMLIAKLAYIMPLGLQTSSESYIDRSIGLSEPQRHYLISLARPLLMPFRNWKF